MIWSMGETIAIMYKSKHLWRIRTAVQNSRAEAMHFLTGDKDLPLKDGALSYVKIIQLADQVNRASAFNRVMEMLFSCPVSELDVRKHPILHPWSNPCDAFSPQMKELC